MKYHSDERSQCFSRLIAHTTNVVALAWNGNESLLASGDDFGNVGIWQPHAASTAVGAGRSSILNSGGTNMEKRSIKKSSKSNYTSEAKRKVVASPKGAGAFVSILIIVTNLSRVV